jgi:hypothetical protein
MRTQATAIFAILFTLGMVAASSAAELAILGPDNWDKLVPQGKEVDAIYGDIVLRNDRLVAVIARPVPTRNANMTVKNVGGCLIDFTLRDAQNDQLSAWYPLGKSVHWQPVGAVPTAAEGPKVRYSVTATIAEGLAAETTYELADGSAFLNVETKLTNSTDKPINEIPSDEIRADGTVYAKGKSETMSWAYDRWWNAAYGVLAGRETSKDTAVVPAHGSLVVARRIYVAADLNDLQQLALQPAAGSQPTTITVLDDSGRPIANAYVEIKDDK